MNPKQSEELRGIVARGYCHEKNASKVLDGDLLEAIVEELLAAESAATPAPPTTSDLVRETPAEELRKLGIDATDTPGGVKVNIP